MSAPGAEEVAVAVMGFPADAGNSFASALRDGVLAAAPARTIGDESTASDDPQLPPLRLGASYSDFGRALGSPAGSSSSSSDAFLSMSSTPSGNRVLPPIALNWTFLDAAS